jgi:hypothetical protein
MPKDKNRYPAILERRYSDRYEQVKLHETFYTHYVEQPGKSVTVVQAYRESNTSFEEVHSRYLSLNFVAVKHD